MLGPHECIDDMHCLNHCLYCLYVGKRGRSLQADSGKPSEGFETGRRMLNEVKLALLGVHLFSCETPLGSTIHRNVYIALILLVE